MNILGVDIGGTKISVCVGTQKGNVLHSKRIPTVFVDTPEAGLHKIKELAYEIFSETQIDIDSIEVVGTSVPGPVDVANGLLLNPPNLKLDKCTRCKESRRPVPSPCPHEQ